MKPLDLLTVGEGVLSVGGLNAEPPFPAPEKLRLAPKIQGARPPGRNDPVRRSGAVQFQGFNPICEQRTPHRIGALRDATAMDRISRWSRC
jgi:hypothetical protein